MMYKCFGLNNKTFICFTNGMVYFRIKGLGLMIKDLKQHPKIFSERYNLCKGFGIMRLYIRLLRPDPATVYEGSTKEL